MRTTQQPRSANRGRCNVVFQKYLDIDVKGEAGSANPLKILDFENNGTSIFGNQTSSNNVSPDVFRFNQMRYNYTGCKWLGFMIKIQCCATLVSNQGEPGGDSALAPFTKKNNDAKKWHWLLITNSNDLGLYSGASGISPDRATIMRQDPRTKKFRSGWAKWFSMSSAPMIRAQDCQNLLTVNGRTDIPYDGSVAALGNRNPFVYFYNNKFFPSGFGYPLNTNGDLSSNQVPTYSNVAQHVNLPRCLLTLKEPQCFLPALESRHRFRITVIHKFRFFGYNSLNFVAPQIESNNYWAPTFTTIKCKDNHHFVESHRRSGLQITFTEPTGLLREILPAHLHPLMYMFHLKVAKTSQVTLDGLKQLIMDLTHFILTREEILKENSTQELTQLLSNLQDIGANTVSLLCSMYSIPQPFLHIVTMNDPDGPKTNDSVIHMLAQDLATLEDLSTQTRLLLTSISTSSTEEYAPMKRTKMDEECTMKLSQSPSHYNDY